MAVEWDTGRLIKAVESDVEAQADKVYRRKVLRVFRGIIKKTPVDTGRARGNWFATVNSPYRGSPIGSRGQKLTRRDTLEQVRKGRLKLRPYYLSNNLPYIERLEFGHSKRMPRGMIRVTFAEEGLR